MKTLHFEQGGLEWMAARLGIATASSFDHILTPKTLKPAKTAYFAELLAEWLLGQPLDWGTSNAVERGTDLEDEARRYYSMEKDVDVDAVGFVIRDDGKVGGSPDGLVEADGVLEIKNPMALKQTRYMLGADPDFADLGEVPTHKGQIQGYLYLTGRAWVDVLSYNPDLPPVIVRFERDEEYLKALVPVLDDFVGRLDEAKAKWADHRVPRPWHEGEGGDR